MKLGDNGVTRSLLWILPAVFLIGLISMPREEYIADPMAVRCEAVSLINNGTIDVPKEAFNQFNGRRGQYFFENPYNHKWYSKWGIMNGLINVPPLLVEKWWNGSLPYFSPSRAIFLNFLNLILSIASAFYLCLIVSRYTRSPVVITLFVLTAFYCTYWWNYLRAQNSEIYQTLFMLAYYYHITSHFRPTTIDTSKTKWRAKKNQLLLAGIFLGILILVKPVYVILFPVALLWITFLETDRFRLFKKTPASSIGWSLFQSTKLFVIPTLFAAFIVLATNAYKFGSPFEAGFSQWGQDNKPLFSGNIFYGMYLMLFDIQGSAFLAFPILIFALFGYPRFFKTYPADACLFLTSGTILFLINAKLLNPLGLWSYGPRYMLVVLPLNSLPFFKNLELLFCYLKE